MELLVFQLMDCAVLIFIVMRWRVCRKGMHRVIDSSPVRWWCNNFQSSATNICCCIEVVKSVPSVALFFFGKLQCYPLTTSRHPRMTQPRSWASTWRWIACSCGTFTLGIYIAPRPYWIVNQLNDCHLVFKLSRFYSKRLLYGLTFWFQEGPVHLGDVDQFDCVLQYGDICLDLTWVNSFSVCFFSVGNEPKQPEFSKVCKLWLRAQCGVSI